MILIPSTSMDGSVSRIVPGLKSGAVVLPRCDVSYVISEYGAVNLFGKNLQERATAMISLAHPDFRDELFENAKELGLITPGRKLSEFLKSVYPVGLEEVRKYDGQSVKFRPAKPVDIRRIQEHFYNLDRSDVVSRFFYEKTAFLRDDVEAMVESDYIRNLTILAVTGEFGFGTVIGLGAYMLEPENNTAEIAFSVSRPWQGKGIASVILYKLAEAARNNGIKGLTAYTSSQNRGMVKLFHQLPYKVHSHVSDGMLVLSCRFDEKEEKPKTAAKASA